MERREPQQRTRPTRRPPTTPRISPTRPTRPAQPAPSRRISGIVGGVLLGLGVLWIGWLLVHQLGGPALPLPTLPIINFGAAPGPDVQSSPLAAAGITVSASNQTTTVSKQQALLIASQLEPDASAHAKSITAQLVLLNYANKSTPATHADFNSTSVWMVLYQKIPLQSADPSVDPTPLAKTSYDLYVFLDATSGKELLKLQA